MKGSREEIAKSLNHMETRITSTPNNSEILIVNNEWRNECKRLGMRNYFWRASKSSFNQIITFSFANQTESEMDKIKFQTSDDMNDCVKFISTINDKLNQVALVSQNQHSFTE